MKANMKTLAAIIIIALLAGALSWALHDRHLRRQELKQAIEAMHEARSETDKHVETIQRLQAEYVERVKSRDVRAQEGEVNIRNEVQRHSESIPSDDLGYAIELELELYERGMGAGLPGVDGE